MSRDHKHSPAERSAPVMDATIRIDNIPPAGRDVDVDADADQRVVIAERMNVTLVQKLVAHMNAKRFRGGIRVLGTLDAIIEQPCVISFVSVSQTIHEEIDRIFLPQTDRHHHAPKNDEILIDAEGEDEPDIFDGNEVDLSELVLETLALAIDPYPRAKGAAVDTAKLDKDEGEVSPFSALKALKTTDGNN